MEGYITPLIPPGFTPLLIGAWISRFGIPIDITSDRGPQFTSALWSTISQQLGVQLHRTTAYHPQANVMVERFHRTLKSALKARLSGDNWIDDLPWVLLGLRVTPKEDLHSLSAEMVYSEPLTLPGEFVPRNTTPWTTGNLVRPSHLPIPTTTHKISRSYVPTSLISSRFVFIRHDAHRTPLQCPYDGPYEVCQNIIHNSIVLHTLASWMHLKLLIKLIIANCFESYLIVKHQL